MKTQMALLSAEIVMARNDLDRNPPETLVTVGKCC